MPPKITPLKQLSNGILRENPVFRLVLGTCPALAVTTQAMNGLGMGAAIIFVLVCSNVLISMLRNVIPNKVRIPVFITIIAAFVAICQMVIQAFLPSLYDALGIFIPLITVNCIILARAEAFASKNTVFSSAIDGLGMGLGATFALVLMGSIREVLGNGTLFGASIPVLQAGGTIQPMLVFILPPGGFFVYGILIALTIKLIAKMDKVSESKIRAEIDIGNCAACPAAGICGKPGDPDCPTREDAVSEPKPADRIEGAHS
ncbi:MAG: electron transport complex subunit E [Clostridia bacterium]|nr:electron transport complex subunit E [Clostridia bacterium]